MMKKHAPLLTLAAVLSAAACGDRPPETPAAPGAQRAAAARVIEVKMVTDEKGNYFEPAEITARTGDVLRLTLISGVHNLSFPPEKNPAGATLPARTDFLQITGQAMEVPVTMGPGRYVFQCDPHAPFAMVGTLTVE